MHVYYTENNLTFYYFLYRFFKILAKGRKCQQGVKAVTTATPRTAPRKKSDLIFYLRISQLYRSTRTRSSQPCNASVQLQMKIRKFSRRLSRSPKYVKKLSHFTEEMVLLISVYVQRRCRCRLPIRDASQICERVTSTE